MAYASITILAQTIDQILHHEKSFIHEKQQIITLHDYILFLQAFLEDFPDKSSNLEGRIRDVANGAQDVIEKIMWEQIWSYHNSESTADPDQRLQYDFNKLDQELETLKEEIESIAEDVMDVKDKGTQFTNFTHGSSSRLAPNTNTNKGVMVGFNDDLMAIKTRLCGESSKLQVIPICGMGGIGKTTLARNAYDDQLTVEHFDIRAWVTVSQDYSLQEIVSTLLVSLQPFDKKTRPKDKSLAGPEDESLAVYQSLKGRRYLIVMDDMWSTQAWDDVMRLFPDENNGSRVILTTRLADVAAYPTDASSPLHEMHFMDVDQSWNLLRQKVFKHENDCPLELEKIGRRIAESCKGLPLAIVVVAGILSTVGQTLASWENTAENVKLAANDEQFAILSLSYSHLPHQLRPCFLYMGGFPEDYEIRVSKLIKLWVAEGFLKPSSGSKSFEDGAEEYLEDLIRRSLVLVTKRKPNGKIKSCGLHDLVRDLCIIKAREEKFLLNFVRSNEVIPKGTTNNRRVSVNSLSLPFLLNMNLSTIRTFLCFPSWRGPLKFFERLRLLRVLDAVELQVTEFPVKVTELFFLRYLAIAITTSVKNNNFNVPSSIVKLQNLQTLFIKNKVRGIGICLPSEIWMMPQLRHLVFRGLDPLLLPDPCAKSFVLGNLHTLGPVEDFKCTERILQIIPNLKKLSIFYYVHNVEWPGYHLDNLVYLRQLENLNICVRRQDGDRTRIPWFKLSFPMTLKKLTMRGLNLRFQDMATVGSLPNLEVLKLIHCSFEGGEWETTEGEFLQLKSLQIIRSYLSKWITESNHFPCLEHLMLYQGYTTINIPDAIGEMTTLELIEVYEGNPTLIELVKQRKEVQESYGNDSLQVRLID